MDRQGFETELKRDGYDEVVTGNTQGPKHNAEHSHPYDVRAMVLEGAITLAWEGKTQTYRPGEIFTMARNCPHTETFGPEGAVTLAGRKHL